MRNRFVALVMLAVITSPAFAAKKTSLEELQSNGYESIVATKDQTPRFTFHAPKGLNASHFIGGVIGIFKHAKAAERGSQILTEYKITEPATDISKELSVFVSDSLHLTTTFQDSGLASSMAGTHFTLRSPKNLSEQYGSGKLVVNVGTMMWSLLGTGDSKFRILYSAKAQLVDTSKPGVLASSECTFPLKKGDSAREASTMFDDNAASLKAEFGEVTRYCVDKFKTDLLGL